MSTMTPVNYIRRDMERLIAKCERWAESQGMELEREGRYPRLPFRFAKQPGEWYSWIVDAMLGMAHAMLVVTDANADPVDRVGEAVYAFRCYGQIQLYAGRAGGMMPDASWYDYTGPCRDAMEYLLRRVDLARVISDTEWR